MADETLREEKIVLVEDDVGLAELIAERLRAEGFSVLHEVNGRKAPGQIRRTEESHQTGGSVVEERFAAVTHCKINGSDAIHHSPSIQAMVGFVMGQAWWHVTKSDQAQRRGR